MLLNGSLDVVIIEEVLNDNHTTLPVVQIHPQVAVDLSQEQLPIPRVDLLLCDNLVGGHVSYLNQVVTKPLPCDPTQVLDKKEQHLFTGCVGLPSSEPSQCWRLYLIFC